MPIGEPGGPDTEMFWDFGAERGLHERSVWKDEPCHPNCDCGRFIEIGNNVFMEYQKTENGFAKLAQQNVDFGGGLERLASALTDEPDMFRNDLFTPLLTWLEGLAKTTYGKDEEKIYAFRVLLDHLRASVFLISDGVQPSNTDQGYVLRRLLRRAVRVADQFGLPQDSLRGAARAIAKSYAESYPELSKKEAEIARVLSEEEQKFRRTLERGLKELEKRFAKGPLSGQDAFDLFTTYGFSYRTDRGDCE